MMKKHASWWRGLLALLGVSLLLALTPIPTQAAEFHSGPTVTIVKDEVIDEDLFIAGGAVSIEGTVNGDVFAGGGSVTVNGVVNGSVTVVGGTVTIGGMVTHAVRVGGGLVRIYGEVGGDLMIFGRSLELADTAKVGGDLILVVGDARIGGVIEGMITGGASEVIILGLVKGDINLNLESLVLLPTARIEGDILYTCENEAGIQSGAQVKGNITHNVPEIVEKEIAEVATETSTATGKVIGFLMALTLGIVAIFIAPRRMVSIAESVRNRLWASFGWGALLLVATPVAIVAVGITIIGIPLSLIILACYLMSLYLSQVFVGLVLGQWIIGYFRKVEGKAAMVGALALGLAILVALRIIPYFGYFVGLATILLGLGALLVSEWRLRTEARRNES